MRSFIVVALFQLFDAVFYGIVPFIVGIVCGSCGYAQLKLLSIAVSDDVFFVILDVYDFAFYAHLFFTGGIYFLQEYGHFGATLVLVLVDFKIPVNEGEIEKRLFVVQVRTLASVLVFIVATFAFAGVQVVVYPGFAFKLAVFVNQFLIRKKRSAVYE